MAPMADMKIPHDKVNVNGGACALGHPGAAARAFCHAGACAQGCALQRGLPRCA